MKFPVLRPTIPEVPAAFESVGMFTSFFSLCLVSFFQDEKAA